MTSGALQRLRRSGSHPISRLVLGAVFVASTVTAQDGASPTSVPGFVADAARTSAADFAYALAEARVPAGFVGPDVDFFGPEGFDRSKTLWHIEAKAKTRQASLADAVAAFRASFPAYDVEGRDGVLLVRAKAVSLAPLLDARIRRLRLDGEEVGSAMNAAERSVDSTIPERGGVVGSLLSNPDEPPPTVMETSIKLDLENTSFLEALNAIVKQAPGTVWILSRHRDGYFTLAYRLPGGIRSQLDDPLLMKGRR